MRGGGPRLLEGAVAEEGGRGGPPQVPSLRGCDKKAPHGGLAPPQPREEDPSTVAAAASRESLRRSYSACTVLPYVAALRMCCQAVCPTPVGSSPHSSTPCTGCQRAFLCPCEGVGGKTTLQETLPGFRKSK